MPKYLGDVTAEPLFAPTKAALEERRYHDKIPCADVLRAAEPRYDTMDKYQRNLVDWIVGTSAKFLGYDRVRTTVAGVRSTYFYVYRGVAEPEPGQPVARVQRRPRRVTYDDPTKDPWYPTVGLALIDHKVSDQAPCQRVYRAVNPDYDQLDNVARTLLHTRVSAIVKRLGYYRVKSSAPGVGSTYFYRKLDLSVPRFRRSGSYPELYDERGRPKI